MKRYTTIALTGIVFAVTLGMLGANGFLATPFGITDTATTMNGGIPMKGHVTVVLYTADGAIKAYRQMDNIVVNQGKDCTSARLFGAGTPCAGTGTFNFIGIGTGVGLELTGSTSFAQEGFPRIVDPANAITSPTSNIGSVSTLSSLFSMTGTFTIAESGIFDATSGGNMFARKLISPTVNTLSGDTLTVTWTITSGSF